MNRKPVVAGQFYPGRQEEWLREVIEYLAAGAPQGEARALLAMVPHAGYIFSGKVAGRTIARANPVSDVLLLGPNHTGRGAPLAVWSRGAWELPGTSVPVAEDLADHLLQAHPGLQPDETAHVSEHSLEVLLPFLWARSKESRIMPICVSEPDPGRLVEVGHSLAQALSTWEGEVSVLVSSDMSHFISLEEAKAKDEQALQAVYDIDPEKLYHTVRSNNISMCGVLPMTVGLSLARSLGASKAELVQYATSADMTGDTRQVVGYAGVVIS